MGEDECPELGLTLQNHFRAIDVRMGKSKHSKHRQSLVTLSRRHSMIQMLDNLELDGPTPVRRISLSNASNYPNHYLHHFHQSSRMMDASMRRANVCITFLFAFILIIENCEYYHYSLVVVHLSKIWNKKVVNWHHLHIIE